MRLVLYLSPSVHELIAKANDPKKNPELRLVETGDKHGREVHRWMRPETALAALAAAVKKNPRDNTRRIIEYGKASSQVIGAFKQAGLDVSGYSHIADNSAIRHTFKHHGDAAVEAARGQVAVTPEDFALLPGIISKPDSVRLAGKTRQGRETVRYAKRINGYILVVEEARTGRGQLALVSMWKTRPRSNARS